MVWISYISSDALMLWWWDKFSFSIHIHLFTAHIAHCYIISKKRDSGARHAHEPNEWQQQKDGCRTSCYCYLAPATEFNWFIWVFALFSGVEKDASEIMNRWGENTTWFDDQSAEGKIWRIRVHYENSQLRTPLVPDQSWTCLNLDLKFSPTKSFQK